MVAHNGCRLLRAFTTIIGVSLSKLITGYVLEDGSKVGYSNEDDDLEDVFESDEPSLGWSQDDDDNDNNEPVINFMYLLI